VTVDVLEDGSRRPGGTALYSGLQASRLGLRTLVLTRGHPSEIEACVGELASEFELRIEPARQTTTLLTGVSPAGREPRLLAWAGEMKAPSSSHGAILHLAPVARELPLEWDAPDGFIGLTPQGLVRRWREQDGRLTLARLPRRALRLADAVRAIVVSELEHEPCAELIAAALERGSLVAVTAAEQPVSLMRGSGQPPLTVPIHRTEPVRDDLGAGDVFAAAFFISVAGGSTPERAVAYAAAAAAVRVAGTGPDAIGDRRSIERLLEHDAGRPKAGRRHAQG
jgi:sugar/nucleoside kinase (ribokinase family)